MGVKTLAVDVNNSVSTSGMHSGEGSTPGQVGVALGVVQRGCGGMSLQDQAARLARTATRRLYIVIQEGPDGLLSDLAAMYEGVASINPRLYTVPLLPWAGWTLERVAGLEDVEGFVTPVGPGPSSCQEGASPTSTGAPGSLSADALTNLLSPAATSDDRRERLFALLKRAHEDGGAHSLGGSLQMLPAQGDGRGMGGEGGQEEGARCEGLRHGRVAMGGTFDRLHCGHMLLLAAAALVAEERLFVGVTADALLAKKAHRELLQPYSEREAQAVEFLQLVRPALQVQAGPLRDPQEPTAAELDPAMQAIVVSEETVPGARQINEGRARHGFPHLQVVVVQLVGTHHHVRQAGPADNAGKLSSTELRAADAALMARSSN